MTTTPARILGSETHTMTAQPTGRTYHISVSLPLGYGKTPNEGWPFNETPTTWPTVYVLDGNWYYGMVTDMVRPTAWCGSTTDAIVVGIGYPESADPIEAFRNVFTRRDHDLTPIEDPATQQVMEDQHKRPVPNGDASGFLTFIHDELIPFIEGHYRADATRRVLVGHSYGGLFGLYALFERPGLFSTLVMGSPTLAYGEGFIFQQETAFAGANSKLPASIYLYVGDEEIVSIGDTTLTDTLRFAAILENRAYEGFSLNKRVFMDYNHCEAAAPGIHWGLKHALAKH